MTKQYIGGGFWQVWFEGGTTLTLPENNLKEICEEFDHESEKYLKMEDELENLKDELFLKINEIENLEEIIEIRNDEIEELKMKEKLTE